MPTPRSRSAHRVERRRRRGARSGQSFVEFAIVSPLLLFAVFALLDVGRAVYIYNSISSASREGARLVALGPQLYSDCDPLNRMKAVASAFTLQQDPNSIASSAVNVDPNAATPGTGPTKPNPGQGNMYIYPAVAPSTAVCDSTTQRACPPNMTLAGAATNINAVAVEIQYNFQPWTPVINNIVSSIDMKTISETPPDYC